MKKLLSLLLSFVLLLTLTGCPAQDKDQPKDNQTNLTVHFIDVGQADCALLECNGEYMLIDGGNKADSSLVVSYLQKQGVQQLRAVVCSHAHEDHVGGLPGVLAVFPTDRVWAPTRAYASDVFDDFVRYTDQQGLEIAIPAPGDYFFLGNACVTVLGPVKSYAEPNNTSLVLRVDQGETRFLFTGDMETEAENDMLEHWGDDYNWHADVLKVGHHGSNTSTGYRFLRAVMPQYGVISVGKDNSYGHPHEEPMSRLRDAQVQLYRTDEMGTILAVSDGKTVTFSWEKGSARPEDPTQGQPAYYIGNKNSRVLHLPTCSGLPAEKNQVIFDSYEDAMAAGYTLCSRCMK
ncbi:MAG: MBL fold metallo-hydrolase [Ruminococcaceae bacterium]|nr:MBL fold metallo-hydrolase [Oscillospiraceae bacterium]